MAFMKKLWRDKRGNALIIMAGALPLVIGSAGLASDTIQWTLWKRQLQRAADSAALAAVYDRIANNGATTNVSAAVTNDLGRNNHTGISLVGGYPQLAYPAGTNWTNPVRVTLALQKSLGFSSVFLANAPVITTQATAATVSTGVYCVVSLVETGETGIKATGNGDINMGCGMITNSTSLTAAIATGSSEVTASPIAAVGDIQNSDNWGGAELLPFTVKQADPFKDVNPPAFSPCQGNANKLSWNNTGTYDLSVSHANQTICVSAIDLQKGIVNLGTDAVYVIDGGSFDIGSQSTVNCTRCTIILTNSDTGSSPTIGKLNFNANGQINMSAPTSGTYDGILFYQDRRAPSGSSEVNKINGNSDSVLTGAFYFPKQQIQINGSGGLTMTCAQFVSYTIEFSGNSSINNTCTGGYGDGKIMGKHVRLVA